MTEIPAHLLKRAQAARDKAAADGGAGEAASGAPSDSRIPEELLNRSKAAAAGGVAVAERVATGVATTEANGNSPLGTGPGGHTQRLLTVVKSGSIQDVKAMPVDKVHTWLTCSDQSLLPRLHAPRLHFCSRGLLTHRCCKPQTSTRHQTHQRHLGTSWGCKSCSPCFIR